MVEVTVEVIIVPVIHGTMARPHTATPPRPAAVDIATVPTAVAVITIIITAITAVAIIITIPATTAETATTVAVMVVMATAITDIIMAEAITDTETEVHRLIHRQVLLPRQARRPLPTTGVFRYQRPPQADIAKNKADSKKESAFSFF